MVMILKPENLRVIVCAGAVLVFGIIQMLAYMNGLLIN